MAKSRAIRARGPVHRTTITIAAIANAPAIHSATSSTRASSHMLEGLGFRERIDDARYELDLWIDARESWIPRALLLAYLAYAGVRHMLNPLYGSWFSAMTLAFHEMGHIVFIPLGRTLTIAGGSIMQLLVPLAAAIYLLVKQKDWFGLGVGLAWLSFSTFELATYIGDAARMELPLVSLGGGYHHDWSTLLTEWHMIDHCDAIATVVRVVGGCIWLFAMAEMGYIVVRIALIPRK